MFHSLNYNKCHSSISYFVQYAFGGDIDEKRFGMIEFLFTCEGKDYALIKHHRAKELFSDTFKNSSYYHLVKELVDQLCFILENSYSQFNVILVRQILNHCAVVYKNDYLFVTNILSYNEHDRFIDL